MPSLPHKLHIYGKPAAGDGNEYHQYIALNYRHKISANGWFDTASCDVGVDRAEAEYIFGNLVGNRVAVYVDNPVLPIWEGFISRVTISAGSIEISRSLDAMANRVVAQFTDGTLNLEQTAEATDTTSIALYGSKMKTLDMGEMYTSATAAAEALRDARSAQLAYPVITTTGGASSDYRVSIEMLGFYHTLTWDTFEVIDATTSTTAPREILNDAFGDDYSYNYGIFYDETDSTRIASTAFAINNSRQLGESSWDLLTRIAEAGDSGVRRIVGIGETNPNTGARVAYYEDADETIVYTTYAYADGRIYNTYGQEIYPWDVRPNRGIRINNILIGQPDGSSDAKTAYITSVDYDAETGGLTWASDDNVTLEGVFNLGVTSKATNERFGAEQRDVLVNALTPAQGGTGSNLSATGPGLLYQPSAGGNIAVSTNLFADEAGGGLLIGSNPDAITNLGSRYLRIGGDTGGSPTVPNGELVLGHASGLETGEVLGAVSFYSSDESAGAKGRQVAIKAISNNVIGSTAILAFFTGTGTNDGTVERMRLEDNGLLIGVNSSTQPTGTRRLVIGSQIGGDVTPNAEILLGQQSGGVTGDILGQLSFGSLDASSDAAGRQAAIRAVGVEAAGRNARLAFATGTGTEDGSVDRLTIEPNGNVWMSNALEIDGDLNHDGSNVGFYGTAPIAKPTVSGSRGGNAALASLLTAFANLGLIINNTSA